ncbi:hypothetical protein ACOME3_006807 [Neoechinorhynchus agilis]
MLQGHPRMFGGNRYVCAPKSERFTDNVLFISRKISVQDNHGVRDTLVLRRLSDEYSLAAINNFKMQSAYKANGKEKEKEKVKDEHVSEKGGSKGGAGNKKAFNNQPSKSAKFNEGSLSDSEDDEIDIGSAKRSGTHRRYVPSVGDPFEDDDDDLRDDRSIDLNEGQSCGFFC